MSSLISSYDWRKAAAQGAQPDDAIEKAFFDQAATFISNKAAPLMRDPYRLGFEIVQKNDDNNKMVGIFAFRISKDLLYAPVFFLNGEIKGTDLLYRHTPKTFCPLNEDWAKFLLEQDEQDQGKGQDRSERKKHPADMQLRRIAMPPFSYNQGIKAASTGFPEASPGWTRRALWLHDDLGTYDTDELQKSASEKEPLVDIFLNLDLENFFKEASTVGPLEPILRRFLLEDGGWDSFEKIAYAIEHSPEFAERLLACTPEDHFMPPELGPSKSASAPECEVFIFTGGLPVGDMDKSASDRLFSKGYSYIDKRAEDKITALYDDYGDGQHRLETVGDPGFYKILLKDGEMVDAFCARESDETLLENGSNCPVPCTSGMSIGGYAPADKHPDTIFITKDGTGSARLVLGQPKVDSEGQNRREFDATEIKDGSLKLGDSMETGNLYRAFDPHSGCLSGPFYCASKSERDGVTIYEVSPYSYGATRELKVNPDYDRNSFADGMLGGSARFIKVKGDSKKQDSSATDMLDRWNFDETRVQAGDEDNLRDWIYREGEMKRATITHKYGAYTFRADEGENSPWLDKLSMLAALAGKCHVSCEAADEILDKAAAVGEVNFLMDIPMSKRAGTIRLMQTPEFRTYQDSDFGVDVDYPQRYGVPTNTETDVPPEHRIGDAHDPGMGHGPVSDSDGGSVPMDTLLNSTPQQLAQLSQQDNMPHMFEHGVVGSLVNTYDSSAMIDKYLPDMEQGMDRGGRILFLFYWKPGDFQNLYGVDDMQNLENKLTSNFKSWGDLVLDLLKKTRNRQKGTVPLGANAA